MHPFYVLAQYIARLSIVCLSGVDFASFPNQAKIDTGYSDKKKPYTKTKDYTVKLKRFKCTNFHC